MEIIHCALAYRLFNSAKFTNEQKRLVKATVSIMDYQIMKDQLKRSLPVLQLLLIKN